MSSKLATDGNLRGVWGWGHPTSSTVGSKRFPAASALSPASRGRGVTGKNPNCVGFMALRRGNYHPILGSTRSFKLDVLKSGPPWARLLFVACALLPFQKWVFTPRPDQAYANQTAKATL